MKTGGKTIAREDARYPAHLAQRLGTDTPSELTALGNHALLALPKTALFCSARCPGSVILPTYDQAAKWRDTGRCVISGFHSPVEQECLRILLRGMSLIIVCPARALPKRIQPDWQQHRTSPLCPIPLARAFVRAPLIAHNDCESWPLTYE